MTLLIILLVLACFPLFWGLVLRFIFWFDNLGKTREKSKDEDNSIISDMEREALYGESKSIF